MDEVVDRISHLVDSLYYADKRELEDGTRRIDDRLAQSYLHGRLSALDEVRGAIDGMLRRYRRGDAWERDDNDQQEAAERQQEDQDRIDDHMADVRDV
jgi:hypothetical protein